MDDMLEEALPLRDRLNLETARISWKELERYFAGGKVLHIAPELDLIEVAACISEDNANAVQNWVATQQLRHLTDDTAKQWVEENPDNLWAIVVAPWVLVQQRTA